MFITGACATAYADVKHYVGVKSKHYEISHKFSLLEAASITAKFLISMIWGISLIK